MFADVRACVCVWAHVCAFVYSTWWHCTHVR